MKKCTVYFEFCGRMSKFSNSIVLEIRLKYKTGKYTSRVLAQEYSMSKTNILDIVHHRIWQNI